MYPNNAHIPHNLTELQNDINKALAFDFSSVTTQKARRVLERESLTVEDLAALLSPAAENYLEPMAQRAMDLTKRFFGRNINLFTPLYLSNYCLNLCAYCGFSFSNKIRRGRLNFLEIEKELLAVKETGLKDILLLTGDNRAKSGPAYIAEAVKLAAGLFPSVGLEVYPLKTEEYAQVKKAGADYVCVYQETYDPDLYGRVHLKGPKRDYLFRLESQSRALSAGIRGASLGALLGLGDFRRDVLAMGVHGLYLSRKFPASDLAYSVPRLRPVIGTRETFNEISEKNLFQIILALRIFSPSFGLTLSTREQPSFRDRLMGIGVNRLSAGVSTSVGGYAGEDHGDNQFLKSDSRDVGEVCRAVITRGFQPVFTDYARL
ncbi:MAG: 2-iminoacetate synthase ThiH [Deltaproteobacteria bacterium]|jgi:2-iminoacetate synthase|nr:2-iminoacetate synthase ThiH [Deltaproteobacteria bacterium]